MAKYLKTEQGYIDASVFAPAQFKPAGKSYLTFSSPKSFTLKVNNATKNWDGTLEYFSADKVWAVWDGTTILSAYNNDGEYVLYLRGTGNTVITGNGNTYYWVLTGSDIACIGNIENLLDYATVESGQHPTMADYCYPFMFYGCTSLTQAPDLPATTLTNYCYCQMFVRCTSLTQAPVLPAITLSKGCYQDMFFGCTSLTQAPTLTATTLADYCYADMFYGCTSLTQAPALSATTLSSHCYHQMFSSCTSLTQTPALPATTLANDCYYYMFHDCTSLTKAPALPATTLAKNCYYGMFSGCTSLTQVPALPATTLVNSCYQSMFSGCTSLKLSSTKTGEYTVAYRIPTTGVGLATLQDVRSMFFSTGGTFTAAPSINTTYYLSTDNMIVRETEVATLNGYVGSMIDNSVSNPLNITGATVGQIAKITAVDESGKPTAWEAVDMPSGGGGGTKMEKVTVGSENVTLDSGAPSQTVNLAWNVPGGKTIPPFTNYYSNLNGKTYPRELGGGYNQFWSSSAGHGNADAFDSSHKYFMALKYELDGDSTAYFEPSSTNCITPTNSMTLSGSGWIYAFGKIATVSAASWYINSLSGTGRVYYVYCIDVTALQEAGTITATTVNELAELFGGLELIPGQDYAGSVTSGMATLNITRDGETTTVDSGTATATVQGGDILSVEGGSVTFLLKVLREVYVDSISVWEGKKWVAFGDSLTDETINADKKYYRYIEEKTGITVVVMGAGGTGYYKGYDSGTAYGQRMANVPADADVITIFGSVNDWHTKSANVEMGNASDTMEAGTLAGYINECIDVAVEKAPYAQIALVTLMDYHGLPDDTLEAIANTIKAVAAYRKIKCLDLYHESGFRVDNPTFAAVYTTDYSETAESYGHPSNLAHEQLIAPEFMELLKRMLLTA